MIDLHTHTTVSDGTDTPAQLVNKALAQGLDTLAKQMQAVVGKKVDKL